MKKLLVLIAVSASLLMGGCSDYRTIPISKVGIVIDKTGVSKDVLQPGTYDIGHQSRVSKKLALLDTSVETIPLNLTLRLADDQELGVQLLVKTRIATDNQDSLAAMFGLITPDEGTGDADYNIPLTKIYAKLGQDLVRRSMVEVITPHTLESFRTERKNINDTIERLVDKRFDKTPLLLLSATINRVDYPAKYITTADNIKAMEMSQALTAAEEVAKRARLKEEEATIAVEQRVRLARAETVRLENMKTSAGLNPLLLEYRKLELEERRLEVDAMFAEAAKNSGNSTIFYPSGQRPDYVDVALSKK